MWVVAAAALAQHEISAEVEIRLVLIVGPAAQRDIARRMLTAFPIGLLVMVLHTVRGSAATILLIDERATTTVTSPYLASDSSRDRACSAIATFSVTSTLIAGGRSVGHRGFLFKRIVE